MLSLADAPLDLWGEGGGGLVDFFLLSDYLHSQSVDINKQQCGGYHGHYNLVWVKATVRISICID